LKDIIEIDKTNKMDQQLPDTYFDFKESELKESVPVESFPQDKQESSSYQIQIFIAIVIVFILALVYIFGWSSMRGNPFSVLANYFPLESWLGSRDTKIVVEDSLRNKTGVTNQQVGKFILKLSGRNIEDQTTDFDFNINSSYVFGESDSTEFISSKIGGTIDLGNGLKSFNIGENGLEYIYKQNKGLKYININFSENFNDLIQSNFITDKILGQDILISESDNLINAILFENKNQFFKYLSLHDIARVINSNEYTSQKRLGVDATLNLFEYTKFKRNNRLKDSLNRESVEYTISDSDLESVERKSKFIQTLSGQINDNVLLISEVYCSEISELKQQECKSVTNTILNSNSFKEDLPNLLKYIAFTNFKLMLDPITGNVNQISFTLDLPDSTKKNDQINKIGNHHLTDFHFEIENAFVNDHTSIQIMPSKISYEDLIKSFY
jgi:hypothetical protein